MVYHHKVDCLVKRLDYSVVVQLKVTGKVQSSSECSSGWYLLNFWTFCNQTWYGDATSWAKVSCKKIGLLSLSSGSLWGLILSDMTVSTVSTELLIFFITKFNWMVHYHRLECFVWNLDCSFQVQDHCEGSKLYWIFMHLIPSVPMTLVTKEGVLIYYS